MTGSVSERLAMAKESFKEGEILLQEGMGNKLVLTKLYHVMMYCLFALFEIRNDPKLSHEDIISRFEREYVRTGKIDSSVLEVLRKDYNLTHECDCDHMPVPTDLDLVEARGAAKGLLDAVNRLLKLKGEAL
jgi:uncharacterized protein (UPF0332 family)